MVNRLLSLFVLICLHCAGAQAADAPLETRIFNDRVRTLQVRNVAIDMPVPGPAVMLLDAGDAITVDFDVLAEDRDYLRYSLTHCNADWRPSQLSWAEYLDGFNEGTIDNYRFSNATTVHYVHYSLSIPNDVVRPTVSGNYVLTVYSEDDPDTPWLQCRFVITEQTATVGANLTSRTDVDYNRSHQQLEISVNTDRANVLDLFNDISLVITQNGRTDNAAVLTKPLRVSGRTLVYEHLPQLIFSAGNEYRRFEAINNQYPGPGVDHTEYHAPYYHAVLDLDGSRAGESYHYDRTLAGGYIIREYNSSDPDVEADYNVVHFTLDYPETPGFDFYIDGDFVQRAFSPESRMVFNRATGRYERALLLKQGAYSYQYLAVAPGSTRGRTDIIEGDKYETQNRYRIYVYHRAPGDRYDRLIAVSDIGSL